MLSEARPFLQREPRYPLVPGSMIVLAVLAVNLIGDGLVDALNPRRSQR
jgi:ABC-type dipeptide/oligopeptide/nickel transport system permease subunit